MTWWAVKFRSQNRLDGYREHFCHGTDLKPVLFRRRCDARDWAERTYGYIGTRTDLKKEPHGWKAPKIVKVKFELQEIA